MPTTKPIQDDPDDKLRCAPHLSIQTHGACRREGEKDARAAIGVNVYGSEWDDLKLSELLPKDLDQNETCASYWVSSHHRIHQPTSGCMLTTTLPPLAQAIARVLKVVPRDYDLFISTHNELVANTLQLCMLEREKHGEATTTLPRGLTTRYTKDCSYTLLIRRILQAVQSREREHCNVYFVNAGGKPEDFSQEAER